MVAKIRKLKIKFSLVRFFLSLTVVNLVINSLNVNFASHLFKLNLISFNNYESWKLQILIMMIDDDINRCKISSRFRKAISKKKKKNLKYDIFLWCSKTNNVNKMFSFLKPYFQIWYQTFKSNCTFASNFDCWFLFSFNFVQKSII